MNKRKGSLYEQQSRVTPILKNTGQPVVERHMKDEHGQDDHPQFQQHHYPKNNQHHYRLEQIQKAHQFKLKENTNNFEGNQGHGQDQAIRQGKKNRAHSAQRSSSLDKRRQEMIYANKQYFIENIPLQQHQQNNLIAFIDDLDPTMEKQIYEQGKQQMSKYKKLKEETEKNHSLAERSLKIEELRNNYKREKGGTLQIEESLANQLENSTHYQEEFEYINHAVNENEAYLEEATAQNFTINQHVRTQYRKQHAKNYVNSKQTFENIKQIIKKQQKDMKEYLEQRTTDTTDDQNISINPNNKSSSDEAILTSADFKYRYDQFGNDNQINGNYLPSNFHYPKKGQVYSNVFPARELSTSHDTTKLIDDESGNKQQNSENNIKSIQENNSNQKEYQEYLSETQIHPIKNQFNNTHPSTNYKHFEFLSGDKGHNNRSNSTQKQDYRRKNTPSQGSSCKHTKKNLSIISDKFEDILECKVVDHQLCPKQSETRENKLYQGPNKIHNRSKSETKNCRQYRDEHMLLAIQI